MDLQLSLFGAAQRPSRRIERIKPALGKAETSREAAASIEGSPAAKQRQQVLGELRRRGEGGATRQELAKALGLSEASVCGRVDELIRLGEAFSCGIRRPTESGRSAAVVFAHLG